MHKHTIKLLNILAVLGLSHLVVLYTAVIQNTANEPLNYHPDGPFWLALQCFLAQYITFKCYQHSSALKLTSSNSLIKVYLNSSAMFILTNTGLVLGLEWFIGLNPLDYRHGLLTMLLSFLLHLLIGGALMSFLFFNEAQKQHLARPLASSTLRLFTVICSKSTVFGIPIRLFTVKAVKPSASTILIIFWFFNLVSIVFISRP